MQGSNWKIRSTLSAHPVWRKVYPEPCPLRPHPSTLNPQPSTITPQPSTPNPQRQTLDPQVIGDEWMMVMDDCSVQWPYCYKTSLIPNPKPQTLNPKPSTSNPKPNTRNSKP